MILLFPAAPTRSAHSMRGHLNIVRSAARGPPDAELERFMLNLAVCNTVVPAISEEGHYVYQVRAVVHMACVAAAGARLPCTASLHKCPTAGE